MERSDAAAVAQARAGDAGAFAVLVERHSRSLFRLAYRMTGNEQDAEDVVQESFLRAYRQLKSFDARAGFGTWLYRITTNCSLDLLRARRRRREHQDTGDVDHTDEIQAVPAADPTPERFAWSGELKEQVEAALNQLSAMERAAFVLRHFEGMCMQDVGRTLGVQPGAAKHSVFRAVQKLRRTLEPIVSSTL